MCGVGGVVVLLCRLKGWSQQCLWYGGGVVLLCRIKCCPVWGSVCGRGVGDGFALRNQGVSSSVCGMMDGAALLQSCPREVWLCFAELRVAQREEQGV